MIPTETPATPEQLALLREILGRPEFLAEEGRGVLDILLDPVRLAIGAAFLEVIRALARLLAAGGGASGVALLAIALVVVGAAGLVVWRLARGTLAAEAELAVETPAGPPRAEVELARAHALARAGELRPAVHHRYLATLRHLDERGLLLFDRSRTNREHLGRITAGPGLAGSLEPLVATFDRLWYGQSSCTAEEYARFAALADRVWSAASTERPRPEIGGASRVA